MKSLFLWVLIFAAIALVGALDGPELHSFQPYIQQQKNRETIPIKTVEKSVDNVVEKPAVAVYNPSPIVWR